MIGEARPPRFEMIVGVHDLADPPVARDDELLSWMAFSEVAPLLERLLDETRRTGVPLRVTSDDAFLSDYDLLVPWLLDHRMVGTFFVPTRFLDRPGRLSVAQLREIASLGMAVGVHGAGHLNWAEVPESVFLEDLHEGRERLQEVLGLSVDRVAPPFGGFGGRIVARLAAEGFREIHTCRPGLALRDEPLKPRNMIKRSQIAAVLDVGRRAGGPWDAARCRLRRIRAALQAAVGAA